MNSKDSTTTQYTVENSELIQILQCIHDLEARISGLETDVSMIADNENACSSRYRPMTIYDFIGGGDDAH